MSSRKKPGQSSSTSSQSGKGISQRARRAVRSCIDEYILDHQSQNHSPKTIEWHTLALGKLTVFLEKQGITCVEQIERVHLLSWLSELGTEPGARGKPLAARSMNCYARSMRAFCNWLEAESYVPMSPANHVRMPKAGKPFIRILVPDFWYHHNIIIDLNSHDQEGTLTFAILFLYTGKEEPNRPCDEARITPEG